MAYSELIKNFNGIRSYLRSFYVFGFMHRDEFTQKSSRSYDNERRRIESWFGCYISFGTDRSGRRVFMTVDSRAVTENPLFQAFRTSSFTMWDIFLHFHLLDILSEDRSLSFSQILDCLAERIAYFVNGTEPDESTVRKKLKEYAALGLVEVSGTGRDIRYRSASCRVDPESWERALAFFSEIFPVGVIGSFVRDRTGRSCSFFRFKHHYIVNAIESEIVCRLLCAARDKRLVLIEGKQGKMRCMPLKLYVGTGSGRQFMLVFIPEHRCFSFYEHRCFGFLRVDRIDSITDLGEVELPGDFLLKQERFVSHCWGVSARSELHHIEMILSTFPGEEFVAQRLNREKRCGKVEQLDECTWRFTADVYDPQEMLPWLRTFTGRVKELNCTLPLVTQLFWSDFRKTARMYGVDIHDLQ